MNTEPSIRRRISPNENLWIEKNRDSKNRILLIGDLHLPFIQEGYLEHCRKTYKRFNCNKVIFMGDIIDSHASSYHESDPDGMSAGDELRKAQKTVQGWYDSFPDAIVLIGNHDAIPHRKAMTAGLSGNWIRSFNDVLEIGDGWKFVHEYIFDDVLYVHGTGTSGMNAANKRALENGGSVAMGHLHTQSSISHHTNRSKRFWGMIVGAGMDIDSYASAYAKNYPRRAVIACGVVLDDGMLPISVPMNV